jgi:hypothetical protein
MKKNVSYKQEVTKLIPFHYILLSTSSTSNQLARDLPHFSAEEFRSIFEELPGGRIQGEKHEEVRHKILNSSYKILGTTYAEVQTNSKSPIFSVSAADRKVGPENATKERLDEIKEWIVCNLNQNDIQKLAICTRPLKR